MKVRALIAIGCIAALPVVAQKTAMTKKSTTTTTTTTTDNTATPSATTETKTKTTMKKKTTSSSSSKTKVWNDATRLAAILNDAQNDKMNFSADAWKVTANEANSLANRIYAQTGGKSQAKDLRMHVRLMHDAAMKGDAAGARQHASEALPFAYQLIDWAMPAQPAK